MPSSYASQKLVDWYKGYIHAFPASLWLFTNWLLARLDWQPLVALELSSKFLKFLNSDGPFMKGQGEVGWLHFLPGGSGPWHNKMGSVGAVFLGSFVFPPPAKWQAVPLASQGGGKGFTRALPKIMRASLYVEGGAGISTGEVGLAGGNGAHLYFMWKDEWPNGSWVV